MFIGHFAVGLGAKSAAQQPSLGTFFLASQFVDLLWPTLPLVGWERVEVEPGATAVTPLDFVTYPDHAQPLDDLRVGAPLRRSLLVVRKDLRSAAANFVFCSRARERLIAGAKADSQPHPCLGSSWIPTICVSSAHPISRSDTTRTCRSDPRSRSAGSPRRRRRARGRGPCRSRRRDRTRRRARSRPPD